MVNPRTPGYGKTGRSGPATSNDAKDPLYIQRINAIMQADPSRKPRFEPRPKRGASTNVVVFPAPKQADPNQPSCPSCGANVAPGVPHKEASRW